MRAEYLLDGIQYELIRGSLEVEVCDITDDSRQVSRGAVFVCMPGPVTDGHIFIGDAIRRGAAGIIVTCGEIACKQDVTCEIDNDATKYSDIGLESDVALSENGDLNDFFVAKLPDWENEGYSCDRDKGKDNSSLHDEKGSGYMGLLHRTYWNNRDI